MAALGRMAGGAADEFNNLLTTSTGFTDRLRAELAAGGGSRIRDCVREVRDAGRKANGLTAQLLALSRKQRGVHVRLHR